MGVKYYTHFVLVGDEADARSAEQEYRGVVEVNRPTDELYETRDIEALLARNFNLSSAAVRLINWSRLQ